MTRTKPKTKELFAAVSRSGYYPQIVSAAITDALADEPVVSYVLQHEPTFDREEIRRHMSVLVLTPTRLLLTHTDEHSGDTLLPEPYTSTSAELIPLGRIANVVVTRMVSARQNQLEEAVLTISWGAVRRVDLEPARCDDPQCEADHGYTGSIAGDDFSLRMSAAAEGGTAVEGLLEFARALTAATSGATA